MSVRVVLAAQLIAVGLPTGLWPEVLILLIRFNQSVLSSACVPSATLVSGNTQWEDERDFSSQEASNLEEEMRQHRQWGYNAPIA